LDRASVFGTEGWEFEPLWTHFWKLGKSKGKVYWLKILKLKDPENFYSRVFFELLHFFEIHPLKF
jgi:hypothetical protein